MTPVLLMLVFGIFEFGFAFRDYLAVANATRDGARAASVAGPVADADHRALDAIERAAAALPDDVIDRIVIFEASGPDDSVPGVCTSTTDPAVLTANACNLYFPSDFELAETEFGCDPSFNPDPDPDRHWCPFDREVSVGSGLDFVGVYMRIEHTYITGLFGSSITFEDTAILKVEPQEA